MQRRRLVVRGVVQGVGFRPFVAGLARRLGLGGWVRNESGAVIIEAEGPAAALDTLAVALRRDAPPLAAVGDIEVVDCAPTGEATFHIDRSRQSGDGHASIPPDVATCDACLRELADPADRRHGYPFLNCTQCGPRFTVITALPYDRASTTMARFTMCDACAREYEDPADRRYHAEPTACPVCGPHAWVEGPDVADAPAATRHDSASAMAQVRAWLAAGRIVAIKGIGGFHLACDATDDDAVRQLRARKGRGAKPFALMVDSLDAARRLCVVSDAEALALQSRARPIVLLRRRADGAGLVSDAVAPAQDTLGLMLPYSPLHRLIVGDTPLVLTSGNRADEPIARTNEEARERLTTMADGLLLHDRDIHAVCDDSVVRVVLGAPVPVRRSRGYAPYPIALPFAVPAVLAVGAELKATCAVAQDREAWLSQHVGDMETVETLHAFERAAAHLLDLFAITPARVAFDPHPGYLSSRWARQWAASRGIPTEAVHHHHAHHAALMAEHGLPRASGMIGVVFDGTGYGPDGTVWGGEVFVGGYTSVERAAHLATTPLPAGDADVRHVPRLALAHLTAAGIPWGDTLPCVRACPDAERQVLAQRLARGLGIVASSSMGRLFDACAALLGLAQVATFEAQAAIALETAAGHAATASPLAAFAAPVEGDVMRCDPAPMLRDLVARLQRGEDVASLAAGLHVAVADAVVAAARHARARTGLDVVGLSGGVFQNVRLTTLAASGLDAAGFRVLLHRQVPPNDGGLALGQAVVAGTR
ncbi:carbamoyltransferase [Luteitalea sp. TBR-22]|uniref:carbamoyltransferase HypF n=1 Tax=Luteitalea sp. TBR-22 TaxID=2802971 RepID=UPI001AF2C005|nr:carbamoyltransferase HypF [Luteitalea sp. TBR-22]BCS32187.1 carbamoyltransferase [Luteitalea sp. TBR-22]